MVLREPLIHAGSNHVCSYAHLDHPVMSSSRWRIYEAEGGIFACTDSYGYLIVQRPLRGLMTRLRDGGVSFVIGGIFS